MKKLLFVAFCTTVATSSFGASVWTGNAGDGKWDTAGNWDPEGVPNLSSTDVVISNPNVGTTLTITRPGGEENTIQCKTLTFGEAGKETGEIKVVLPSSATASSCKPLSAWDDVFVYTDVTCDYLQTHDNKAPVVIADGKTLTVNTAKGQGMFHGISGGTFVTTGTTRTTALRGSSDLGYTLKDISYISVSGTVLHNKNYKMKNVAVTIANGKSFVQQNSSKLSHYGPIQVEGYFNVTNAGTATMLYDYTDDSRSCHMCTVPDCAASFTKAGAGVLTFAHCFGTESAPWAAPATFEEGGVKFNKGAYVTGTLTLGSEGKTFTLTKGTSGEIKANTLVYNGLTLSGYAVNDVVATTVTRPANRCQPVKATIDSTTYDYYLYWEKKTGGGYDVTLVDHLIKPSGLTVLIQ